MRQTGFLASSLLALMLAGSAAAAADSPPERKGAQGAARAEGKADEASKDQVQAPVAEQAKSSDHSITLGGRTIRYRATAGTLTIRDKDGKPTASVFYVAYTSPASPGRRRPVTIIFFGGFGFVCLCLFLGL